MKKNKRLLIVSLLALILIIIFTPILAPFVHNNDSPRSALREAIFKGGHPYQSFFALITKDEYIDKDYGQLSNVYWFDYDSLTGNTASLCYTKEVESEKYEVSCGTGP